MEKDGQRSKIKGRVELDQFVSSMSEWEIKKNMLCLKLLGSSLVDRKSVWIVCYFLLCLYLSRERERERDVITFFLIFFNNSSSVNIIMDLGHAFVLPVFGGDVHSAGWPGWFHSDRNWALTILGNPSLSLPALSLALGQRPPKLMMTIII